MAIQITQEQQDGVRILALSGRLDTETAADVELTLQDLLAAGENRFLFDLSGIGYVSSGAGHWLPFRLNCPPEVSLITLKRKT